MTQVFINSIIIMAPGKVFVFAWVPCNKVHSFTHHWNSSLNFQESVSVGFNSGRQ